MKIRQSRFIVLRFDAKRLNREILRFCTRVKEGIDSIHFDVIFFVYFETNQTIQFFLIRKSQRPRNHHVIEISDELLLYIITCLLPMKTFYTNVWFYRRFSFNFSIRKGITLLLKTVKYLLNKSKWGWYYQPPFDLFIIKRCFSLKEEFLFIPISAWLLNC